MNTLLRRKIDSYLLAWKSNPNRKPQESTPERFYTVFRKKPNEM